MKNTLKLKGTFSIEEDGKGKISLTMNGLTKDLPIEYSIQGDNIEINASMNLDTWEAQAALDHALAHVPDGSLPRCALALRLRERSA